MSHAKASTRKRGRKAVPVLGAAGVSLSLVGGASAVTAASADTAAGNASVTHEITLAEEEIFDVSLATFYVFDKEGAGKPASRLRVAMGACGCGCQGCGGCGCWTGTYYDSSVFDPGHHLVKPAPKHGPAPRRKGAVKNP